MRAAAYGPRIFYILAMAVDRIPHVSVAYREIEGGEIMRLFAKLIVAGGVGYCLARAAAFVLNELENEADLGFPRR